MGTRKTTAVDVSRASTDIKTGMTKRSRDESGGCPCSWPGGVRHAGGVSLVCGCCAERGKARADTAPGGSGARGSVPSSRNCEALSTVAAALADRFVVVLKLL